MEKSLFTEESSNEKQYPNPNPESRGPYKPFHIRENYSPGPKLNSLEGKYTKGFHRVSTQASDVLITLNGAQEDNSENSTDFKNIKDPFQPIGELEAVPERSVEYSEVTNKTTQMDLEMVRGRSDYDTEDRKMSKPLQAYLGGSNDLKYKPYSKMGPDNLNTEANGDSERSLRNKNIVSSNENIENTDIQELKYKDLFNKRKNLEKERYSTSVKNSYGQFLSNGSLSNLLAGNEKVNGVDKEVHVRESSHSETNSSFIKKPENDWKLNKSHFLSRSFRDDTLPRTQEQTEIIELMDQNEKLERKVRRQEQMLQEIKKIKDEIYVNYRETRTELEELQQEREMYKEQQVILNKLRESEALAKREIEELRLSETRKVKMMNDMESQIRILKNDLTYISNKYEAKIESFELKIKKLKEENQYLQDQKKEMLRQSIMIQQLEMSYDDEKKSLRKNLEESRMKLDTLAGQNENLLHKIETLRKFNKEREKTYMEKMDESKFESKRALEDYKNQIKEELTQHFKAKIHRYESKIEELSAENENLKLELQSKPSLRKFRENETRAYTLENELEELKRELHEHKRKPAENALPNKILKDIIEELGIENIGGIIQKIKDLQEEHKAGSKLVNSLLDLVQKCSPRGYFEGTPTHKQAWKWIQRIMEEYMTLKKQEGGIDPEADKETLKSLMNIFNLKDKRELPSMASQILSDNIGMSKVISKVKTLHKLEWVNNLQELEQKLQMEINSRYEDPFVKSLHYKRNNT